MSTGLKANPDGSAAIQVGGTDVITLTSGGAATFVTSPTTVQAGTAAAPSITTSGDTNTGIFFPAADTIAFAEGGVEAMRIDSSGNVGIGTISPTSKLHVVGAITATQGVGGTPAFSAQITTTQTITLNVNTKVVFGTEYFDTNSNYDAATGRFTPTVAGYYQINSQIYFPANSASYTTVEIQKNGTVFGITASASQTYVAACPSISTVVYCNGSTDYIEVYAASGQTGTITLISSSRFSGALVRAA